MKSRRMSFVRSPDAAAAVLHPIRRQILASLREPDSASGLARRFGIPRQKVNYHLRALERVGLVVLTSERPRRNCVERLFRATGARTWVSPRLLQESPVPGGVGPAERLVEAAANVVDDMGQLLDRSAADGRRPATLVLEFELRFASAAERNWFADELGRAARQLAEKYARRGSGTELYRFLLAAHPLPR